jgi:hypothetical protein
MNDAAGQINSQANLCAREKYWDELTDAERIQRLGQELLSAWRVIQDLQVAMHAMQRHEHGSAGKLVVPIDHNPLEPIGYNREHRRYRLGHGQPS